MLKKGYFERKKKNQHYTIKNLVVRVEHILHLFLVFTVYFEQLDAFCNRSINMQLQ